MNYRLNDIINNSQSYSKRLFASAKELGSYLDKKKFFIALVLVVISSIDSIVTPFLLGVGIDQFIAKGNLDGLFILLLGLFGLFILGGVTSYFQQSIMGKASQEALYKLRGEIFSKIQSLPIAFFSQNKTGDLMSRINNDTDKLSQFLSESILRFTDSAFTLLGIAAFIIYLDWKLALVLLSSTLFLFIFTRLLSPLLERKNRQSSAALGDFTAGVTEQLSNFKAIVAFDRRNFFEQFLGGLNKQAYKRSRLSEFLNQLFAPFYDFAGYISQAIVLAIGLYFVVQGEITIGLLIAFLNYAIRFYDPLRWVANIFSDIQVSLASWGRVRDILALESNVVTLKEGNTLQQDIEDDVVLVFDRVDFGYEHFSEEKTELHLVLKDVSFALRKGKTYALVGPTGGGKSTIASLMARLYDPVSGTVFWKEKDIRTYERDELSASIGVILQDPFLFSGTIADNIRYGKESLKDMSDEGLDGLLKKKGMEEIIKRFPEGLKTVVQGSGENISIGQKQLVSFVRTVLREPELLILDEATANIDTVTESVLQNLIDSLPGDTTKVIIAHRLNTIKKADEILFVGGAHVKMVRDDKEVIELLKSASRS